MTSPSTPGPGSASTHHAAESLGASLGPALREHCKGRLGPIEWFHNGWQHSGAATGFSTWTHADGTSVPVLVKLPVGPVELEWTVRLAGLPTGPDMRPPDADPIPQPPDLPTPHVLAAGVHVGHYELAWLVTERLAGQTLSHEHDEASIRDLLIAVADFQECATRVHPLDAAPPGHNWERLIEKARHNARDAGMADAHRWTDGIKKVQKHLGSLLSRWGKRHVSVWCHGDLHPGNALRRAEPHQGASVPRRGAVLIDLALVHAGHWMEDALYLERLHWAKPELLHGVKPVSFLAHLRRERGLPVDDQYPDLAMVRRTLMAACVPAFLEHEGHPKYLKAALEHLERALPQVAR